MSAEALTLEQIARTSDREAVRARFDARNAAWLRVLITLTLPLLLGTSIALLVSHFPLRGLISLANLVAAAIAWFLLRRCRTPGVIAYVIAQTVLLTIYAANTEGLIVLCSILPLLLPGFRMRAGELLLMHGSVVIILIAAAIFVPPREKESTAALVASGIVINTGAAAVELWMSRRMARDVTTDFTSRRAQAREQLRMRDELRYAREIQLSMLPECAPALDWIDVAAASHPASEVGGDYYDYFMVGESLAIVAGDVAGHGLASGIVLAAMRSGFTLLRDALVDPAAVLTRLHGMIAQTSRRRMLVASAVLLLDRERRRATIAAAGHPPLIVRRSDRSVERFDLFASPLGVRLPLEIPSAQTPFAPGDCFILHTDGVYESRNAAGESYGIDRIEEVVHNANAATAAALRDSILDDVTHFRGLAPQDDDITVVVARITEERT